MKGSSPPMTLQMLVPLLVPLTVTWWLSRSWVRDWSFSAVGICDVYLVPSLSCPLTWPDVVMVAVFTWPPSTSERQAEYSTDLVVVVEGAGTPKSSPRVTTSPTTHSQCSQRGGGFGGVGWGGSFGGPGRAGGDMPRGYASRAPGPGATCCPARWPLRLPPQAARSRPGSSLRQQWCWTPRRGG